MCLVNLRKYTDMKKSDIIIKLKKTLERKRFEHTLGVAYTAAALAMCHDADMEKAYIAGLLHDCAKGMTASEKLKYCKDHNLPIKPVEYDNPSLLHSKVGSYLADEVYEIKDREIADAIFYHTTGKAGMGLLESIIFVADYIEPGRTHDPELPIIRKEAFNDLNKTILHIYVNTIKHLQDTDSPIDTTTMIAYEYYAKQENNGKDNQTH